MNNVVIFDEYRNVEEENGFYIKEFVSLLNEYLLKGSPVVVFRQPVIKPDSYYAKNPSFPILTAEDVKYTEYYFYKDGFKAVLIVQIPDEVYCEEFEKEHFPNITVLEPSTKLCRFD